MANRTIKRIITAQDVMMGATKIKQPLPVGGLQQHDPFLLIHHLGPANQEPGGKNALDVGAHPHRGFEPVSFIFSGEVHHKDSRGNDSVIGPGGVQWMTAGMGIVHSERASKTFQERGGEFEMIQLWINLPKKLKMVQPKYQGFQRKEIPSFTDQDGQVRVNVISGKHKDHTGPVESLTGIEAYTLELKENSRITLQAPETRNALLYLLNGYAFVNKSALQSTQLAVFEQDGNDIMIKAMADCRLLYLTGEPINEPVASWGPYVMNTQSEILQAMRDYQMGKMGVL